MKVTGYLVDIHNRDIYPAIITISAGKIKDIHRTDVVPDVYIMPGLIDSHVHIESSMVTPGAFAVRAVIHGTTGVVSDPHEIANVLGKRGVEFMIEDAGKVPVRFWFGAPSCVPATPFESSGAVIDSNEIRTLLELPEVKYLSEMMNYPGVLSGDKEVIRKIEIAKELGRRIDGHAPGLTGSMLKKYVDSGISTDHECSTIEEAKEKILLGMKILIREGSAARNLNSLKSLFNTDPDMIMLCSDDLHPEMLEKGHINKLVGRLISEGYNIFDVIRSATINPAKHYNLEAGILQNGDSADFIVVDNLHTMNVLETWIKGQKVYAEGKVNFSYIPGKAVNNFKCSAITEDQIQIINQQGRIRIIEAFDEELLTKETQIKTGSHELVESDPRHDILKIVVKERYNDSPPVAAFIKGFGLKNGAFASSVSHDSHNIICVGTNDNDIKNAINQIVKTNGGLAVCHGKKIEYLKLNIGGIITTRSCEDVAEDYCKLNDLVGSLGCTMSAPFMTLSFMALLVIPDLKIGDRGLFDVRKFKPVPLFVE